MNMVEEIGEAPVEQNETPAPTPEVIDSDKLESLLTDIELEPDEKVLFHGTPTIFNEFQTPQGSSEMDVATGGVTYFYDDPERAARYNGVEYVCVTKVKDPVSYAEQREKQGLVKKKGKYTRGVWVALPENSKPVTFVRAGGLKTTRSERKRNRKK